MRDDISVGRQLQALRLARGLRQEDVADRASISNSTVSRLEGGALAGASIATLRAVSRALGMPPIVTIGWRGPEVDRLLDEAHSAMVETISAELARFGWLVSPEYSFSHFGERGAVDVLGRHEATGTLLVIETKTRIWDLQETLATLDRKRRLLPRLIRDSLGWNARHIGVILVLPEASSSRAAVSRRAATFASALPARQVEVREWLREPAGDLRGIWFLRYSHPVQDGKRVGPKRRLRKAESAPGRRITTAK
jgi:transcriptional regulator with XRE-family HTH domain